MKEDPTVKPQSPSHPEAGKRDQSEGLANQGVTQPASPDQPALGSSAPQPAQAPKRPL